MERIDVRTTTAGAEGVAYLEAGLFEDTDRGGKRKAELRGELHRERLLYVGFIATEKPWRRQGAATRLLHHVIELLGVRAVHAGTVDERANAFFEHAVESLDGVVLVLD